MRIETGRDPSEVASPQDAGIATDFDKAISPLGREEFLSKFWRRSFVRTSGQKGRFAPLLTWEELNHILEHLRSVSPRVGFVRDGKALDASLYTGLQNREERLRPASVVNLLSQGATLIVDGVNDLSPSVGKIAEAFEEALHARTTVNMYAGWRTQKGFELHWDNQDTMILQVSGRKQWKVYRPTKLHPFKPEVLSEPTEAPVWEGVLEDGDMIYMPRGWWHVAFPLDEPSLHLTMTIVPANGVDLLRWSVDALKKHAEVRMNVPDPASPAEQKEYVSKLRELILEHWNDDVLERFLSEWNGIPIAPQLGLPLSPITSQAPITMETRIRLATTDQLSFLSKTEDTVSFNANCLWWECSRNLVPALSLLRNGSSRSVRELCAQIPDPAAAMRFVAFLTSLAMGGVVWTEASDAR